MSAKRTPPLWGTCLSYFVSSIAFVVKIFPIVFDKGRILLRPQIPSEKANPELYHLTEPTLVCPIPWALALSQQNKSVLRLASPS